MDKLTKYLTEPFLIEEGVNDPGILKAVFLAGGPGSGKSYVASGLFGIPKKVNVSAYGLKLVNQDKELERMLQKYGFGLDLDDMPEELFRQLTDPDYEDYSGMRGRAKELTKDRKKMYMNGRLGMIIDGTGHKYNSIKKKKMELEEIGYDCFMVFVHTDLEIAQARNMERPRKLDPELVRTSWMDVQKNREAFQGLFGNANFLMVNNNDTLSEKAATKKFNMLVTKGIGSFIRKPVKNFRGKKWIKKQQIMKEAIKIDVNVGDTIKVGRFKNKKVFVKSIGKDKYGMPTINGKPVVKFRMANDKDYLKNADEEFGAPAGMLPSPSRKGINKNKTDKKSGYKKVNEGSPNVKKAIAIAKKAGGDVKGAIKKIEKIQKGLSKQILVKKALMTREVNEAQAVKGSGYKKIKEKLDKYMQNVVYSIVENEDITTNLKEQKKIKKVIGVFGGRFQPFHSGHLATYKWLAKRVDEAYITTSNIKQPPRHPMNFKEKVRHMVKMGIPKNRIIEEKTPYVAANLLKKFDPDTTAVVYAFGTKDAGRLKAGTKKSGGKTYYQDFLKNKNNLEGFDIHGYYLTAPQAGNVSGTQMRQLLGDPNVDDSERLKGFKQVFGYYDKGVYNMMTNKFRKLFESYTLSDELIEEFLLEASGTPAGNLDDGPSTYYRNLNHYKKTSKKWLDSIYKDAGWAVVDYVLNKNAKTSADREYTSVPLTYLDHGQARGSTRAVNKYKKWMAGVVEPLGWEVVDWMGSTAAINNIIGTLFAAGADEDTYSGEEIELKENINPKNKLRQRSKEKELLLMGGAYGHLNHPFDDKNLTFGDFKTLIINTLQGKLDSEGAVTEKTDGQNIMVSWKDGKLLAARNKGHIKNHGAGALDINGVKSMFSGRGDIEKAFVFAMRDLQKAIGGLSDAQKTKIFDEGKKFMSLEVIYPKTANVIPYDKSLLQFHGTIEYDSDGSPIGEDRGSARILAGMIKQINQDVQKAFKIEKPFITNLPKVKDFSKRQSYFLGKLKKLQNEYNLKDKDTLADYHQAYWLEYIYNGAKQTDYKNPDNRILTKLVRRWAFFDKSYKVPQIRADLKKYPKFLDWILTTDKMDHAKLQKQHIRDWEVLFFELGAEILSNLKDFIAANPSDATQKMKKDLVKAISQVKKSKDTKVLNTLKTQLDRLNAIGGLKAVVPTEGITFVYKGKLYKYTGAFAPANQILGMLKFV